MPVLDPIKSKRRARVDAYGSPYFDIYPGAIAAGVIQHFDAENTTGLLASMKYAPLDYILITNSDTVALELQINGQKHYIPAGVIKSLEGESYYAFAIKNLDGSSATTANKIHIVCQKQPMSQDKLVRQKYV